MKRKVSGHSSEYLKRKAKSIKKAQGLTYLDALDQAAISVGFTCWSNFVNMAQKTPTSKQPDNRSEVELPDLTVVDETSDNLNPHRKLLIAATNELLERGLITLETVDDPERIDDGHVFSNIFGYPSVIMWSDIGFQELRISIWWKYNHSLHPQANLTGNSKESFNCASPLAKPQHYRKFVGVTASGWLERKNGKYLQGEKQRGIFEVYTRKGEKEALNKIPRPVPIGFEIEGKVHY